MAQLGLNVKDGALIAGVVAPRSPAARAGMRPRDVFTEVDGTAVQDDSALGRALDAHKPGDTLALTVLRGGQAMSTGTAPFRSTSWGMTEVSRSR